MGHTHYPAPSNVSWLRRAIELEKTSEICMLLYLRASKAMRASEIDGVSGYYSGSDINASGFTRIASETRRCHDASKERAASG
jgi:hypothetical protein